MTKSSILSKLLCLIFVIWGAITWQSMPGLTILPGYLHGCDVLADSSGDFIVFGSFVNDLEFGALRLSSPEGFSGFVAKLRGLATGCGPRNSLANTPITCSVRR